MTSYCLNLLQIALELAEQDGAYEDIATKFFEHFLLIAEAMTTIGEEGHEKDELQGLWDEWEGFYYDILNLPDGSRVPLKVRSLVGLIPLCAVAVLDGTITKKFPDFAERLRWTLEHRPDQAQLVSRWGEPGKDNRLLLSLLRRHRMQALLLRVMDDDEFLSTYGIRSVSKFHKDHPFTYDWDGTRFPGRLRAGRIHHDAVRRQFQLARPDLDADQRGGDRGALRVREVLPRGRLHHRISEGLGDDADPPRDRRRTDAAAEPHLPARRERTAGRSWAATRPSRPTRISAT